MAFIFCTCTRQVGSASATLSSTCARYCSVSSSTTLRSWIWLCSPVMVSVLLASLSGYGYTWQWKQSEILRIFCPICSPQ